MPTLTYSFDASLPTETDHIRVAIAQTNVGDTDSVMGWDGEGDQAPYFSDQTIQAKLSAFAYLEGLAQLCDSLKVQYALAGDRITTGDATEDYTSRAKFFAQLAIDARTGKIQPPIISAAPIRRVALGQMKAGPSCRMRFD